MLGGDWGRDDVVSALEEAAEEAQAVSEEYTEGADNIVDGFGHETYQSEQMVESAESVERWAEALRDAAGDIENIDDPDGDQGDFDLSDYDGDTDDEGNPEDEDEFAEWLDAQRGSLREEIESRANDAIYELEI